MNAMPLLALKDEKHLKNDSIWKNTQVNQKLKRLEPLAKVFKIIELSLD